MGDGVPLRMRQAPVAPRLAEKACSHKSVHVTAQRHNTAVPAVWVLTDKKLAVKRGHAQVSYMKFLYILIY